MLRLKIVKLAFPIFGILVFPAFFFFFNSGNRSLHHQQGGASYVRYERARIIQVSSESLTKDPYLKGRYRGVQELQVKLLTGEHSGEVHTLQNYLSPLHNVHAKAGMDVIVSVDTAAPGIYQVSVYNYYRIPIIYFFLLFFLGSLWWVGGLKGLQAIAGLVFTLICIAFLLIPMLYQGYSPILASVLIVILATVVTLFTITGWSSKTLSAILGTTCGVVIAGIISGIFGHLAHLSGLNTPEAETLLVIASATHLKVGALLFAGVLIASLGAVMDVAMSIASSVYEIYEANPQLSKEALFTSGLHVGRDMMGTMANTLILAFTGTSLNSLLLIYSYKVNYHQFMNMNLIGIEIIQGMAGSTAIIWTVPIIAFIAARLIPAFYKETPFTTDDL